MGPYHIMKVFSNGTVILETIDDSGTIFLVNGYHLWAYKNLVTRE